MQVLSCRGIHLPDAARHSALREAAVKPAASDQVFSLDDVRKVVRQELFCAQKLLISMCIHYTFGTKSC